jgi:hypothetical protein
LTEPCFNVVLRGFLPYFRKHKIILSKSKKFKALLFLINLKIINDNFKSIFFKNEKQKKINLHTATLDNSNQDFLKRSKKQSKLPF